MKRMIAFLRLGLVFAAVGVPVSIGYSQDEEALPASDVSVRDFSQQIAASYEILSMGTKLECNGTSVLGWTNPVRKSKHGNVFVWTSQGRPEVIACIYLDTKTGWRHEFMSITTTPDIQASRDGRVIWKTKEPGIEWVDIDDEKEVANSATLRLVQLRRIARTFSGTFTDNTNTEQLRLMSQPIVRYQSAEAGVVDGAIFSLAQGTNPEILLLIEATNSKSTPWRFALARMTGMSCQAMRDGVVIWERRAGGGPRTSYYNHLVGPVPGSPD